MTWPHASSTSLAASSIAPDSSRAQNSLTDVLSRNSISHASRGAHDSARSFGLSEQAREAVPEPVCSSDMAVLSGYMRPDWLSPRVVKLSPLPTLDALEPSSFASGSACFLWAPSGWAPPR
eukprot:CAMPEP_0198519488 /NCGR_PEP_ID=MMETSP1462-20131121/19753_1 /TAXON_ID=1333877 /ORGANISM="Brandtodinium nutriculum, Strain RCC3387" /LENGTH=120 /DNA_ID=CAMNT_0044249105 /DNA_START=76 /DNA_END=435 /DNA_ORIENTATION=-